MHLIQHCNISRTVSWSQVFDLLPRLSGYPNGVKDEPECLLFRPRPVKPMFSHAYATFKVNFFFFFYLSLNTNDSLTLNLSCYDLLLPQSMGMKIATNIAVLALRCREYKSILKGRSTLYRGVSQCHRITFLSKWFHKEPFTSK